MFHKKIASRDILSLLPSSASSLFHFSSIYLIFLFSSSRAFPRCYYCFRNPRDITKQRITDKDVHDEKRHCFLFLNFFLFVFFLFNSSISRSVSPALMVDKTIWMAQPMQTSRLLPKFLSFLRYSSRRCCFPFLVLSHVAHKRNGRRRQGLNKEAESFSCVSDPRYGRSSPAALSYSLWCRSSRAYDSSWSLEQTIKKNIFLHKPMRQVWWKSNRIESWIDYEI